MCIGVRLLIVIRSVYTFVNFCELVHMKRQLISYPITVCFYISLEQLVANCSFIVYLIKYNEDYTEFAQVLENMESLNLKIWIPGMESPGIFVEVLESPGIWTHRSIFHYTSSEIWVYLCALKVCD